MNLAKLLRYGTQHRIEHNSEGWHLDPLTSYSHYRGSNRRTICLREPGWLFFLRRRLFMRAGTHICPSRSHTPGAHRFPGSDYWYRMPLGERVCSFCGSLHYDDFVQLAKTANVERSTKDYKVYVWRSDVPNASCGGIKFYGWHLPAKD